jgi:hypothetical protein
MSRAIVGAMTIGSQDRPRTLASCRKKRLQEGHCLRDDLAQQPAEDVARRAQHRMKAGGDIAPEETAIRAVIRLEVADDGLNRLAPL